MVLREGPPFYKKPRRDLLYGQTDVHEDDAPVLLALSGIGPRTELKGAGIPVVDDLPGVGKQFSDEARHVTGIHLPVDLGRTNR